VQRERSDAQEAMSERSEARAVQRIIAEHTRLLC
jgi:hypothetical protein